MIAIRRRLDWIAAHAPVALLVVMVMFAMTIVMMTMIRQMNVQPTAILVSLSMRLVRMGRCRPAKQEMYAHEQ